MNFADLKKQIDIYNKICAPADKLSQENAHLYKDEGKDCVFHKGLGKTVIKTERVQSWRGDDFDSFERTKYRIGFDTFTFDEDGAMNRKQEAFDAELVSNLAHHEDPQ